MDFGTNPAAATGGKRKKEEESFGIITLELANGQRVDGYVLITAKNAAKLGITAEQLKGYVDGKKKGTLEVKAHLQFGERDLAVAAPVEIAFAA